MKLLNTEMIFFALDAKAPPSFPTRWIEIPTFPVTVI